MREALEEVALPSDDAFLARYPHQLSGGQQQRVAIAMAFACRPNVIVCDEPTTGLDVTTQARVLATVRELCRSHRVAALYVSHDLAVVAELADRVAVMYAGRIVEIGTRDELFFAAAPSLHAAAAARGARPRGQARRRRDPRPRAAARPTGRRAASSTRAARWPRTSAAASSRRPSRRVPATSCAATTTPRRRATIPVEGAPRTPPRAERAGASSWPCAGWTRTTARAHTLFDIELEVHRHECLALVGESGSGKTTLARCVAGLHKDFTGELLLRDTCLPPAAPPPLRRRAQGHPVRLPEPVRVAEPAAHGGPDRRAAARAVRPRPHGHGAPRRRVPRARRAVRLGGEPLSRTSCRAASASAWRSRARSPPSRR